jgi:predicted helicase
MRQSLLKTFDEIYILDLHGNSKKKETCPDEDRSVDQNVFDIQQGVAIGIFVKYQNSEQKSTTVYHADLWGKREVFENKQLVGGKYHWLDESDISSMITDANKIYPDEPFYLFKRQDIDIRKEYDQFKKITDIIPTNCVGIVTARDSLTIKWSQEEIWNVVNDFANLDPEEARVKYELGKDTRDWKVSLAQQDIKQPSINKANVLPILYRPFDVRYTYYTGRSRGFHCMPRGDVMRHIVDGNNLNLIATRQVTSLNFSHINVSDTLIELKLGSHDRSTQILPLYICPETQAERDMGMTRYPNLAPEFINELSQKLGLEFFPDGKGDQIKTFAPEDIFNYIYAVFHSPEYRTKYAEFLKIDFPRVPLTSNKQLFWELATKGDRLVQLHLMKETGTEISNYPIDGSNLVEQVKYNETQQQIWINDQQYFANIPNHIWNFYIGGYQVCQKWLKDRKGRELNFDDLVHYQNIISILGETIEIMSDIDQIITKHGGFPFS